VAEPVAVLATTGLVFARVGALVLGMPVFSADGVPKAIPVFAALGVTLIVAPAQPLVETPDNLGLLIFALAGELLVGLLAGLTVRAIFASLAMASEIMAMQMGLAMATMLNPLEKQQSGPVGSLASWAATLTFIAQDLHLRCIEGVAASFHTMPAGTWDPNLALLRHLPEALEAAVHLGVQLAGPVLALVWFVNVLVAMLARLAPKMNVFFSIGMTVTSVLGILMMAPSLPWILAVHSAALATAVERLGLAWGPP